VPSGHGALDSQGFAIFDLRNRFFFPVFFSLLISMAAPIEPKLEEIAGLVGSCGSISVGELARGVRLQRFDFSNELNDNNGRKRSMCKDYVTGNRREAMTTKEKVIHAVEDLPDDATIEDAMQRLLFLAKVERGVQEADAEQTIPHAKVRERMAKWLK